MPSFTVEKDGKSFTIEAPDQQSALKAFQSYRPQPPYQRPPDYEQRKAELKQRRAAQDAETARNTAKMNALNTISRPVNMAAQFGDGLTLGMTKRAAGALDPFKTHDDFKAHDARMHKERPWESGISEVGGALAGLGKLASAGGTATRFVNSGAKGLPKAAQMTAALGADGAAIAGTQALIDGKSLKDAGNQALTGGAVGAAAHPALSIAGKGIGHLLKSKPVKAALPSLDDLKAVKDAAYKRVDGAGIRYSRDQVKELVRGIGDDVRLTGPAARNRGPVADVVRRLNTVGDDGIDLSTLEDIRGMTSPNKVSATPTELRDSVLAKNNFDEFMGGITPQVGKNANELTNQARKEARTFIKARELDELLENASLDASSNRVPDPIFSQRKAVKNYLKKNKRTLTKDEAAAMEKFVKLSPTQGVADFMAKNARGQMGTYLGAGAGGYMFGGPVGAMALPTAGYVARKAGEKSLQRDLDDLIRVIRTGQSQARIPTPASQAATNPAVQAMLNRTLVAERDIPYYLAAVP